MVSTEWTASAWRHQPMHPKLDGSPWFPTQKMIETALQVTFGCQRAYMVQQSMLYTRFVAQGCSLKWAGMFAPKLGPQASMIHASLQLGTTRTRWTSHIVRQKTVEFWEQDIFEWNLHGATQHTSTTFLWRGQQDQPTTNPSQPYIEQQDQPTTSPNSRLHLGSMCCARCGGCNAGWHVWNRGSFW